MQICGDATLSVSSRAALMKVCHGGILSSSELDILRRNAPFMAHIVSLISNHVRSNNLKRCCQDFSRDIINCALRTYDGVRHEDDESHNDFGDEDMRQYEP